MKRNIHIITILAVVITMVSVLSKNENKHVCVFSNKGINPSGYIAPIDTIGQHAAIYNSAIYQGYSNSKAKNYDDKNNTGNIGITDNSLFDNPKDNTFDIKIDKEITENSVAYLEYDLYGVQDYASVCRGINENLSFGGVVVKKSNKWTSQSEKIPASQLKTGNNKILFAVQPGNNYGYTVKNVRIRIEDGNNPERRINLCQAQGHDYYGQEAYISGYVTGTGADKVKVYADGILLKTYNTQFEGLINKPEDRSGTWSINIKAVFDDGQVISENLKFEHQSTYDYKSECLAAIPFCEKLITKESAVSLMVSGFSLEGGVGSVENNKILSVTGLRMQDMPLLSPDMINVTAQHSGYRCLPHGSLFSKNLKIRIKYDTSRIPQGYGPEDIRTYYYDENAKSWLALELDSIDRNTHEIISYTNHFTDFVNSILKTPEAPLTQAFTPTSMKDLKFADPMAGYNIMEPPVANNNGTANLSFPLELPKGRQGMQPQLAITYNSDGGEGWLGVGWNLDIPAITVDTRWGVPHYFPDKESESYLVNGEQITQLDSTEILPLVHRAGFRTRNTSSTEAIFQLRVEGSFNKIIRHGSTPKTYWWEVIDKQGVKYYYGKYSQETGVNPDLVLKDDENNIAHWALAEVVDLNGNNIKYEYEPTTQNLGPGVTGKSLYISAIKYTGNSTSDGKYRIGFVNSALPDYSISARYGFLEVNNKLLHEIDISYGDKFIRSYIIGYKEGAFGKNLVCFISDITDSSFLDNIRQATCSTNIGDFYGCKNHTFEYFTETNNSFSNPVPVLTNNNEESTSIIEDFIPPAKSSLGKSTSLGWDIGGSLDLGVGPNVCSKGLSLGGNIKYGESYSRNKAVFLDINGDGLPDRIYDNGGGYTYRRLLFIGDSLKYGDEVPLSGLPSIGKTVGSSLSWGLEGQIVVTGSYSHTRTDSYTPKYFADVNGDGLSDFIDEHRVLINQINSNGDPYFTRESNAEIQYIGGDSCNFIIRSGEVNDSVYTPYIEYGRDSFNLTEYYNYSRDAVRIWIAPYNGQITLKSTFQLIEDTSYIRQQSHNTDGIRYIIQHNDDILEHHRVLDTNYAEHQWSQSAISVSKGDRIYFRLQSLLDRKYDNAIWKPEIVYTQINGATTDTSKIDADGKKIAVFRAEDDLLVNDKQKFISPFNGRIRVKGTLNIDPISDSLFFKVKYGNTIWKQVAYASNTSASYSIDDTLTVKKDSSLTFSGFTYTNVDYNKIDYDFKVIFLNIDTLVLDTTLNSQRVVIRPMMEYNIFQNPKQVSKPYTFTAGNYLIRPYVVTNGNNSNINGEIYYAIKTANKIIKKAKLYVIDGIVAPNMTTASIPAGDVYFEFYCNNEIGDYIDSAYVTTNVTTYRHAGLHCAIPDTLWKFGNLYRGWGQFSYFDNHDTTNITPIDESLLHPNPMAYDTSLIDFDTTHMTNYSMAQGEMLADSTNDPSHEPFNMMIADLESMVYRDYARYGFVSNTQMSNSVANTPATNVISDTIYDSPLIVSSPGVLTKTIRKSAVDINEAYSIGANLGITLSYAHNKTKSKTITDYLDMNGDKYPDIVGTKNIQYTTPQGGLFNSPLFGVLEGHISNSVCEGNGWATGVNLPSSKKSDNNGGTESTEIKTIGSNSSNYEYQGSFGINEYTSQFYSEYELVDINGDGLPDKVFGDGTISLNKGYSFTSPISWNIYHQNYHLNEGISSSLSLSLSSAMNIGQYSWSLGLGMGQSNSGTNKTLTDINGDGLTDIVFTENDGNTYILLNHGHYMTNDQTTFTNNEDINKSYGINASGNIAGSAGFTVFSLIKIVLNLQLNGSAAANYEKLMLVDFNNDGYPDIVEADENNSNLIQVRYNNLGKINLLKKVTTPSRAEYKMDYDFTKCDQKMPQRHRVLASLKVYDGFDNDGQDTIYKKFEYANGYYDRFERTFYGFDSVISKQYNNFNNGTVYRSTFERYHIDDFLFKGLKKYEVTKAGSDTNYVEIFYKYVKKEIKSGAVVDINHPLCYGPYYPAISKIDKYFYEGTGTAHIHTQQLYEHGRFGNVSKYSDLGDTAITDDDMIATISYEYDTIQNLLNMADTVIVKNHDNTILRKRTGEYDNIGQITQISVFYDNSNTSNTNISYDIYGNINTLTLPPNNNNERMEYTYEYENVLNTYPIKVTDNLGYESGSDYDLRLGLPTRVKDIAGNETRYTYYFDGKPNTVTGPKELLSGAPYTIKFDYSDLLSVSHMDTIWATTKHYDPLSANGLGNFTTFTLADGLGRIVQTRKNIVEEGSDKWFVSGKSYYDAYGRIISTTLPVSIPLTFSKLFYNSFPVASDSNSYDVLDRLMRHKAPDQTTTHYQYGFDNDAFGVKRFKTIITDPLNKISISYTDPRGLKTSVTNPLSTITKFVYNALGELIETKDPEDNPTTYLYDLMGKMIQREHPDAGTTTYTFDPAGNLLTTQTENLEQNSEYITYEYDYNRLVRVIYPENPENNVYYEYGDPGTGNQIGRITRMQDASGTQEFYYGNMGEVTQNIHTFVVPNGSNYTFEMDWEYDSWNRLINITYPDGELVSYYYDNAGKLKGVNGINGNDSYNYIDSITYNLYGSRSRIYYGNGTHAIYNYYPLNQLLANLASFDIDNNVIQNIFYFYDDAKNISTVTNTGDYTSAGLGGEYEYNYTYDDLYRLTDASGSFDSYNNGSFSFETGMEYSASGNITNKDMDANLFINGYTQNLSYSNGYSYNDRPHTVTQAGNYTYDWDNNGNLIYRIDNNTERYLCWDEENRMTTVRDISEKFPYLSSYIYNAGGERTWKLTGEQQQMWINGQGMVNSVQFDKTLYDGPYMTLTDKEYTKHIYIEGERICSKIGGGFSNAPNDIDKPVSKLAVDHNQQAGDLWKLVIRGVKCTDFNPEYLYMESKVESAENHDTKYEGLRYFYHTDHLGGSSFISDAGGDAVQHLQYLPFGETFVDERTDAQYNTPYKFSGKEKDDETQYSYFGARYYDSDLSVWISVDGMSDRFPSLSPYSFCANNPVILVDPDGLAWKPTIDENTGEQTGYEWIPESKSYNKDGTLKSGLYAQAIYYSENGTYDLGSDYNMGSSTATVYKADGTTETFNASTHPSDENNYPTLPAGRYEAKVGLHNNSYTALRLGDIGTVDFNNNRIELGTENPAYNDGRTYAEGVNVHKAGMNNKTGMTTSGKPISAACILMDRNTWDSFIGTFNTEAQKNNTISISISRTYSSPINQNIPRIFMNTPFIAPADATRVVLPRFVINN